MGSAMQITRNSLDTKTGPTEWFTGTVFLDDIAAASEPSRLMASRVHFTPGARTAWHTHPIGQTIYVTEGVGRCQRRGGQSRSSGRATAFTSNLASTTGMAQVPADS